MNGTSTPSPAGQAVAVKRPPPRRAAANPLVKRKPKPQANAPQPAANPLPPRSNGPNGSLPPGAFPQTFNQNRPAAGAVPKIENEEFVDIPIYTTKREMLEGYRHHVMRFLPSGSSKVRNVDLTSEAQFSRPVKLHRRDPKATAQMHWKEGGGEADDIKGNGMDEAEREKLEKQRAERRKEREDNLAQMAPVAKAAQQIKKNHFQKKTEQVFQVNSDKAHKVKDFQLRYEEALPWHVEDFDGKNTWYGTYEGALSDCHVMLMQEDNGQGGSHFRMVPLEKWYKFAQKNQFKALSIEEAEARMSKRVKDPRWFMDTQKATEQAQKQATGGRPGGKGLFTRVGERGERAGRGEGDDGPEIAADIDDIDYNYEEAFADDEENALFEGLEDESKEAEEKIKREQRDANIFELKEQKDYDKEEEEEKRKKKEEKKKAKRTRKALMKQEKNYVYEDDSESNPYTSEVEHLRTHLLHKANTPPVRIRRQRNRAPTRRRPQKGRRSQSPRCRV
jgi:transcription initiation factor TFIIF subunit alpha